MAYNDLQIVNTGEYVENLNLSYSFYNILNDA